MVKSVLNSSSYSIQHVILEFYSNRAILYIGIPISLQKLMFEKKISIFAYILNPFVS